MSMGFKHAHLVIPHSVNSSATIPCIPTWIQGWDVGVIGVQESRDALFVSVAVLARREAFIAPRTANCQVSKECRDQSRKLLKPGSDVEHAYVFTLGRCVISGGR
jgi:hypothetical protein